MASKKATYNGASESRYRDDPDHAETASMASAVLLDSIETFPDEELPPYEDVPSIHPDTSEPPLPPAQRVPVVDIDFIGWT